MSRDITLDAEGFSLSLSPFNTPERYVITIILRGRDSSGAISLFRPSGSSFGLCRRRIICLRVTGRVSISFAAGTTKVDQKRRIFIDDRDELPLRRDILRCILYSGGSPPLDVYRRRIFDIPTTRI